MFLIFQSLSKHSPFPGKMFVRKKQINKWNCGQIQNVNTDSVKEERFQAQGVGMRLDQPVWHLRLTFIGNRYNCEDKVNNLSIEIIGLVKKEQRYTLNSNFGY